jgi:hypothetical protein
LFAGVALTGDIGLIMLRLQSLLVVYTLALTHHPSYTQAYTATVIATLFTIFVTAHGIWCYSRKNPFAGHGRAYNIARMVLELFMILIWIGTASLMLRWKDEDYTQVLNLPPFVQWDICIAFTFIEM